MPDNHHFEMRYRGVVLNDAGNPHLIGPVSPYLDQADHWAARNGGHVEYSCPKKIRYPRPRDYDPRRSYSTIGHFPWRPLNW